MLDAITYNSSALTNKLKGLRAEILREAQKILAEYSRDRADLQGNESAVNLAHYLAMRRHDLRALQEELAEAGLSSLGRCEAHVVATLDKVISTMESGCRGLESGGGNREGYPGYREGKAMLDLNASKLFGPSPANRNTRIMVTLPTEAALDSRLVHDLIVKGMDCARINCAHDDYYVWRAMIDNIQAAREKAGKDCTILMDLAGQKIRTVLPANDCADVSGNQSEVRHLYVGDRLVLSRAPNADEQSEHGAILPRVGCSHPTVIDHLRPGHAVWFDDGKIGTVVEKLDEHGALLRVLQARPKGVKLRDDKGINLPDTHLDFPCLTEKDVIDLDFVCKYADMVGFSFVQSAQDMKVLMQAMAERGAKHLGIIAKIETKVAVRNLPEIILTALSRHRLGVMIARGDLAVELGGERLAEIQEELLWLCEAAHIPVIWATQVLESLAKKGVTTRPELTDAAMSNRAECVMLNKGPYLPQAVTVLDSILNRMQDHQYKKVSRMRALHW